MYGYTIHFVWFSNESMTGQPNDFAERIRHYRQSHRESQGEFGERFGVKRLTVANWEKGIFPNRENLSKLTELLNEAGAPGESLTYQLLLPFDQPINLEVKMSPKSVDAIHLEVQLKRRAS